VHLLISDLKQWGECKAGFHDAFKKAIRENSVPEQNCKGIGSAYARVEGC
jgi:hypothetical protein